MTHDAELTPLAELGYVICATVRVGSLCKSEPLVSVTKIQATIAKAYIVIVCTWAGVHFGGRSR